ncbi:MAG: hypothetical protein GEV06_26025 [Luteitalea sp.]|nr:hypothetical protein [Luteitalea sp.]
MPRKDTPACSQPYRLTLEIALRLRQKLVDCGLDATTHWLRYQPERPAREALEALRDVGYLDQPRYEELRACLARAVASREHLH